MANYDELLDMIVEASLKENIGKAAGAVNKKIKDAVKKQEDLEDDARINGVSKVRQAVSRTPVQKVGNKVLDKREEFIQKGSTASKVVKAGEKIASEISKTPIKTVGYAAKAAFEIPAEAIARPQKIKWDDESKKKYKDDPEALTKDLKKNVEKLAKLKTDIMSVEIIAIGFPLAWASAGVLDNIVKILLTAGAAATSDKKLVKAVSNSLVWAPYMAMQINRLKNKLTKAENENDSKFVAGNDGKDAGLVKSLISMVTQVLDDLESWSKSKESIFEQIKNTAKEVKTVVKNVKNATDKVVTNNIAKNTKAVKENTEDFYLVAIAYDKLTEGTIDENEYLMVVNSVCYG